jgi:hypothetical protein
MFGTSIAELKNESSPLFAMTRERNVMLDALNLQARPDEVNVPHQMLLPSVMDVLKPLSPDKAEAEVIRVKEVNEKETIFATALEVAT